MKKIFKIAKLELSILFYSPVAWLAIAIFMVQNGIGFFGMLGSYQEALSMGNKIDNLTYALFPDLNGLFDSVVQNLYLYIPLITMGLMSRELHSGSIKLLLSSPVKIREIVLGKYLSMVGYAAILILILCLYAVAGSLIIRNPDIKLIVSGGVSSMEDIVELSKLEVRSVVVGKAIYENRITIEEIKEWNLKALSTL